MSFIRKLFIPKKPIELPRTLGERPLLKNIKFTYIEGDIPSCEYEGVRYTTIKTLDESYGSDALLMQATDESKRQLVVKKYLPKINLKGSEESIQFEIQSAYQERAKLVRDATFNWVLNGVGAYCGDLRSKVSVVEEKAGKQLVAKPIYLATEYFEGTSLKNYQIGSTLQYFNICIAMLKALKHMHTLFVHGDIRSDNVFICTTKEAGCIVRLTEFSLSAYLDEFVTDLSIKSEYLAPELSKTIEMKTLNGNYDRLVEVKADRRQDIYTVGKLLKSASLSLVFESKIEDTLAILLERMSADSPLERISIENAEQRFEELRQKNLTLTRNTLLVGIQEKKKDLIHRSLIIHIEGWAACEVLEQALEDKNLSERKLQEIDIIYNRLEAFTQNGTEQMENLGPYVILTALTKLVDTDQRMILLESLSLKSREAILYDANILSYLNKVTTSVAEDFLRSLFKSKRNALENDFAIEQARDQWCYCQGYLTELKSKRVRDILLYVVEGYKKVADEKTAWEPRKGVTWLQKVALLSAPNVRTVLFELQPKNRLLLIYHLGPNFLLKLIKKAENYDSLLVTPGAEYKHKFFSFVIKSQLKECEAQFEFKRPGDSIDKWCFATSLMIELDCRPNENKIISQGVADLAEEKWPERKGAASLQKSLFDCTDFLSKLKLLGTTSHYIMILKHLDAKFLSSLIKTNDDLFKLFAVLPDEHKKDLFSLLGYDRLSVLLKNISAQSMCDIYRFLPPADDKIFSQKLSIESLLVSLNDYASMKLFLESLEACAASRGNDFLTVLAALLVDKFNFKSALAIIDKFDQPEEHDIYKRFLLAINQVYFLRRSAEPSKLLAVFSFISKETFLKASQSLEKMVLQPGAGNVLTESEKKALDSGDDIGLIAVRLKKFI